MTNDLRTILGMRTGEMYTKGGYFRYKGKDIVGEKIEINVKSEPTEEGLCLLRQKVSNHFAEMQKNLESQKNQEEMQMKMGDIYNNPELTVCEAAQVFVYQMTSFDLTVRRRDNTIKSYETSYKTLCKYDFMNKKVANVKCCDARVFLENIAKDVSGNTVMSLHTFLKCVFKECVGNGCISINPFDFSINPKRTVKEALSITQQKQILDYAYNSETYHKYYDCFVIMIETGLRIGEFI